MSARRMLTMFALGSAAVFAGCSQDSPTEVWAPEAQEARARTSSDIGQVTDLRVFSATANSVVLTFTEVADDRGRPANYQIRYAVSPIGWGWGTATVVATGTCASPISGQQVGAVRRCTVEGLSAGKTYDFQMVAFRGNPNSGGAVYGPLSNIATGATPTSSTTTTTVTAPGTVVDLAVKSVGSTSVVLRFTQVTDGAGQPADYQVRYAPSPIGWGWGSATVTTHGTCTSPVQGTAIGQALECTVEGLTSGQKYDFQLVSFRGVLGSATYGGLSNVATGTPTGTVTDDGSAGGGQVNGSECDSPASAWIWCDDFERDRLSSYFEYDGAGGAFARTTSVGVGGSSGMRARWAKGQVSVGSLKLAFGRTPQATFRPVDSGSQNYREIYWRVYVRNAPNWIGGGGYKLSRSTIFSSSTSWAQAMIAHVWSGASSSNWDYLVQDPVRGTDLSGNVVTTKYNDFANMTWLGARRGATPLFNSANVGEWHCVEARVRLNDANSSNGVFEVWVNGQLDSRRTDLNWVADYSAYGINAVFLENYWNTGSPQAQERYLDNFVVSTQRIGC